MTYVLNNADVLPVQVTADRTRHEPTRSIWQRLFDAMVESRRRTAVRELRARNLLVNESELVLGGFPFATVGNDASLPFNR